MEEADHTPSEPEVPQPPPVEPAFPVPPTPDPNTKKHGKKSLIIALVIVAVLVVGFVIWKLVLNKDKKPGSSQTTSNQIKATTSDVPQTSQAKTYENDILGLKLSYPDTWKATEPDNKDGVRLESPNFSYTTTDKGELSGNFRVYIRKGARDVDSKYIGRGVAIKPSEKLTYSQPVTGQRSDTLLSSFGLDNTDNFAFFMIAGNFQLKVGDTLGPTYGKEAETFIVAGGYSSKDLADDLATNPVPKDGYDQTNAYKQAISIVNSLQLQ
jgi:hypothetical protein